jgi:hypothetical protein
LRPSLLSAVEVEQVLRQLRQVVLVVLVVAPRTLQVVRSPLPEARERPVKETRVATAT